MLASVTALSFVGFGMVCLANIPLKSTLPHATPQVKTPVSRLPKAVLPELNIFSNPKVQYKLLKAAEINQNFHKVLLSLEKMQPKTRIATFTRIFKPYVEAENRYIANERSKLLAILKSFDETKSIGTEDKSYLKGLMAKYKTNNVHDLVKRVDVIPTSLAVAQAAIESGWGTFDLAQDSNVFYGQKSWTVTNSVAGSKGERYAAFDSPSGSIKAYMRNLNTHPAYQNLREQRASLREVGLKPTGLSLVVTLKRYSTLGGIYIQRVSSIIKNRLSPLDL